jgi:hypothetical protein
MDSNQTYERNIQSILIRFNGYIIKEMCHFCDNLYHLCAGILQ